MKGSNNNGSDIKKNFAITTSHRPSQDQIFLALKIAAELSIQYLPRNDLSIESLISNNWVIGMIVVSAQRISCFTRSSEFFFHPGLARLRINELNNGKTDQMIQAMSLRTGDTMLDCTLGLGTDAIVASYVSGKEGRVTGLESSAPVAAIVGRGLKTYRFEDENLTMAMHRVEVVHTNHKEYLASLPSLSYDIVYFDPMFRSPRKHSPAMDALRSIANPEPVDRETISIALRVCRKRVVMKERRWSKEFDLLGFRDIRGGRYSPVVYGVIDRVDIS